MKVTFDSLNFVGRTRTDVDDMRACVEGARGILLDWDACAAATNHPHDDALTFIRQHRANLAIVSSSSTLMPEDISEILMQAGVDFPATRIFLAGIEALSYAAGLPSLRTLVLGTARMKALARQVGIRLVQEEADIIVLLRDTKFSYAKLERAVQSLVKGARLIVSNSDATHLSEDGRVVPGAGALLGAIGTCVDLSRVNVQYIGKPGRFLFERACAALKTSPEEIVMVGSDHGSNTLNISQKPPSAIVASA